MRRAVRFIVLLVGGFLFGYFVLGSLARMEHGRSSQYVAGYTAAVDSVRYLGRIRGAGDMTDPFPIGSVRFPCAWDTSRSDTLCYIVRRPLTEGGR